MWKKVSDKGESFLVVSSNVMVKDERVSVELNHKGDQKGSTLIIGLANDDDAGQYVCQLGSNDRKELKHTVYVRGKREYEWWWVN